MEKYICMHVKLLQWCLTLCDPMGCSPAGSSVHRILQTRIQVGCSALLQGKYRHTHTELNHFAGFLKLYNIVNQLYFN